MTAYHFKNLVFEGGGVKGAAYVGALEVLKKEGILENIERIGGASAGAINAVLLGLGFSIPKIEEFLNEPGLFKSFEDSDTGFGRDTCRLIRDFGWCKGDAFHKWISDRILEQTGNSKATFADIENMKQEKSFKSIYLVGTNLSRAAYEVFSFEDTPDFPVADAVRISMSIPLFFKAIKLPRKAPEKKFYLRKRNQPRDIYVDGGLLNNYPVRLFDRKKYIVGSDNYFIPDYYQKDNKSSVTYVYNKETLGFRLDSKAEISQFKKYGEPVSAETEDIEGLYDYLMMLVSNLLAAQQSAHLNNNDWARTIYIDTHDVGTIDFGLGQEEKQSLVQWGKEGTENFFAWYNDDSEEKPNK